MSNEHLRIIEEFESKRKSRISRICAMLLGGSKTRLSSILREDIVKNGSIRIDLESIEEIIKYEKVSR